MVAYRESSGPVNSAMTVLNVISYTFVLFSCSSWLLKPNLRLARSYFVRFQRTPAGSDLAALQAHRTATALASIPLEIDTVGEITQFLVTLLLLQGTSGVTDADKKALLSKTNQWKKTYRGTGRAAEKVSERCIALLTSKSYVALNIIVVRFRSDLLHNRLPVGYQGVKDRIEQAIEQCGVEGCSRRRQSSGSELMQCGRFVDIHNLRLN
jgi:hypothetical protein